MVKSLLFSSFVTALVAFPAFAGQDVNETLSASDVSKVSIENLRGEVVIKGWSQSSVQVKGELDEEAEELIFEQDGSQIIIKVKIPSRNGRYGSGRNSKGSELTINVPENVRVAFSGVSTNFDISNLKSGAEGKSVSGDIDAKNLEEHVELATVSGNVEAENLSGKIYLSSVSGDVVDKASSGRINLRAVSGNVETKSSASEVELTSVSGDVEFELTSVEELELSTVSGNADGKLALDDNGRIRMSSVSGDIYMDFTNNVQASFRLKSNAGGDLINRITKQRAKKAKYGPSSKLEFETGNAKASVRGTTVSGTIRISK